MDFSFLADILFPPACVSCSKRIAAGVVCPPCRAAIVGRGFPPAAVKDGNRRYFVGAAGSYKDPVLKALIHGLKFLFVKSAAEPIADMMDIYLSRAGIATPGSVIVPVPLSRRRERMRGFNQSALIARALGRKTGLAVEENILARIRHRKPQSETSTIGERMENLKGCFYAHPAACKNKIIILIDDVTTSGATFREAACELLEAGAKSVIAIAAAKA